MLIHSWLIINAIVVFAIGVSFNYLIQSDSFYDNYQLIRNILAAELLAARFILLCDMRRPDLAKSFYQTARCIKDEYLYLRMNCEIIYWQDISNCSGKVLKKFLSLKYGILSD